MTSALEQVAERQLADTIGEVGITYWKAPPDMTFVQWERVGNTLQTIQGSINWWIGDWLNEGERRWGEMYAQAIECTGWNYERLRIAKYVSANVDLLIRINNLSWTHHRYVAGLSEEKQKVWLETAAHFEWSSKQLKGAVQEGEGLPDPPPSLHDENGSEPQPSDYDEPSEYFAAIYGEKYETPETQQDINQLLHQSNSNEWYTPACYIDSARAVMGDIDTDPASSHEAQITVQARGYFTAEDDGLIQEWYGRVWLNPPYGGMSAPFVGKLFEELAAGRVSEAVVLVNANSTETKWFAPLWDHALCFTDHRIDFEKPTGEKPNQSTHGNVFIYIGPNTRSFFREFEKWGYLVRRIEQ